MFHIINILSTKVLSYLYAVCFGKVGFCKHCHVLKLDLSRSIGGLKIAKTRFSDQSSLSHDLVFRELLLR